MAPSGTLAGLYARTDGDARRVEGAGRHRRPHPRASAASTYKLTDAENGVAQPARAQLRCACSRSPARSTGARARTDGADLLASQWKYVPVRRLALFIEESLFRGTQWAVFEPNDEPLWAQLRLNLDVVHARPVPPGRVRRA